MSVATILGGWATYSKLTSSNDDDWADRLNHTYTVSLIVLFAIFVSTSLVVGQPIECWCPAQFSGAHVAYTKAHCWVKNTYHAPLDTPLPQDPALREMQEITYYQWTPIILILMAFLFKFPALIWRLFNGVSGFSVSKVVDLVVATPIVSAERRDEIIGHAALYLDRWLRACRPYRAGLWSHLRRQTAIFFCNTRDGTYLSRLYLFTKILYVVNVVVQLILLDAFMGETPVYGLEVISGLRNHNWRESPRFPQITYCDFVIRQMQNHHRFTIQCVLPINVFNIKIFTFLWFWLAFVAICTCGNLLYWITRIMPRPCPKNFVRYYLGRLGQEGDNVRTQFANSYLRDDGVFVLRLIACNTSEVVTTDLVQKLWGLFREKPANERLKPSDARQVHRNDQGETDREIVLTDLVQKL